MIRPYSGAALSSVETTVANLVGRMSFVGFNAPGHHVIDEALNGDVVRKARSVADRYDITSHALGQISACRASTTWDDGVMQRLGTVRPRYLTVLRGYWGGQSSGHAFWTCGHAGASYLGGLRWMESRESTLCGNQPYA